MEANEEDEDVVIEGSALHEHLSRCGYTNFESISMPKRTHFEEDYSLNINVKNIFKKFYTKLLSAYSCITQEESISRNQIDTIFKNAEFLLNDHSSVINNILIRCNNNSKKISQDLIVNGGILISSTCISLYKYKMLSVLFTSSVICCAGYIQHLHFCTNKDLKNLILLQNKLFAMCKKSLKILRRVFNIKLGFKTHVQQFFHFLGKRLQYLQPLTETLLNFMENISYMYYECSLLIAKLMPPDVLNEELLTKFERCIFWASGEINYEILKKSYHIYLLIQSEMLLLLAVAYDKNMWISHCQKLPETELAHIILILTKQLVLYEAQFSKIFSDYDAYETEPARYKVRHAAKWHNPSVQLDLASYKLQSAYNQVFSIFKNIDDYISQESGISSETAEILMQKLDKGCKEFSIAKNLAEFIILLIARSGFNNLRSDQPLAECVKVNENSELPIIFDSDPEILDEVFEEYIKEEYLKPLHNEEDEYSEQYKLDNSLMKNFMSELKEALVVKRKSMSDRELKALQRIYKNISENKNILESTASNNENTACNDQQFIPAPPQMPSHYLWLTSSTNITLDTSRKIINDNLSSQEKLDGSNEECESAKPLRCKSTSDILFTGSREEKDEGTVSHLPQILLETQAAQYVMKLPRAFVQEETFIGSGENSEDEIVDDTSDDSDTNENF